jgi:hypothetical protein
MGAVKVTISDQSTFGNNRMTRGSFTFSNSYATGGDTFTPVQFAMDVVLHIDTKPAKRTVNGVTTALVVTTETTSGLIEAYWSGSSGGAMPEVNAGTDLSGYSVGFMAYGL